MRSYILNLAQPTVLISSRHAEWLGLRTMKGVLSIFCANAQHGAFSVLDLCDTFFILLRAQRQEGSRDTARMPTQMQ